MDAVSKIFLHAEKIYAQGYAILGCVLVYRGVVIPYAIGLWASENFWEDTENRPAAERVKFRKVTKMAAGMVEQVALPNGGKAIVLFNSYYLCPTVIRVCKIPNFRFVGVAKKNRNFYPDERSWDKRKLKKHGANVLKRERRWSKVDGKKHRLAERVGQLSKSGRVKLVFSRRPVVKSWIAMATNETRWGVKRVLSHCMNRWPIEVYSKMSKQYLGLGD